MATKVLSLVNNRLKFLYQKQKFFTLPLCRLLCNSLIQPHYGYACSAWYPSLNKRLSKKIQTSQNKCIRFCLNLDNKDIKMIEEQLNTDFSSLCDWLIDNKLIVHFGDEKTKSILFGTKRQLKGNLPGMYT